MNTILIPEKRIEVKLDFLLTPSHSNNEKIFVYIYYINNIKYYNNLNNVL